MLWERGEAEARLAYLLAGEEGKQVDEKRIRKKAAAVVTGQSSQREAK